MLKHLKVQTHNILDNKEYYLEYYELANTKWNRLYGCIDCYCQVITDDVLQDEVVEFQMSSFCDLVLKSDVLTYKNEETCCYDEDGLEVCCVCSKWYGE